MITGSSYVALKLQYKTKTTKCVMMIVLKAPDLRFYLVSVSLMSKLEVETLFNGDGVTFVHNSASTLTATGTWINRP